MSERAAATDVIERTVPPVAAGASDAGNIDVAKFSGTVTSVTYTPDAAITGDPTNNRTLSLINKGQTGSGGTVIATRVTTATLAADDEATIPMHATAANHAVNTGDVLEWSSIFAAAGVADPGGVVKITLQRS